MIFSYLYHVYFIPQPLGPEVFVEILACGGVPVRLDAGGVLGPGRSQLQGFEQRLRGKGLIPMTYLNIKEN